jgi:hypothetical protein
VGALLRARKARRWRAGGGGGPAGGEAEGGGADPDVSVVAALTRDLVSGSAAARTITLPRGRSSPSLPVSGEA